MIRADSPVFLWKSTINGASLMLVEDALQVEAQGITCYSSTSLTLYSVIAQALIERGGASIRAEAAKYRDARVGEVIALPGGKLKSKYVFAAVTNSLHGTPTLAVIARVTEALLRRVSSLGLESLAIPLLRIGRQLEQEEILRATLAPIVDHLCGSTSLRRVSLGLQGHLNPVSFPGLTGYLDGTMTELAALGQLRARIEGLQEIRQRLTLFEPSRPWLSTVLLRSELGLLLQTQKLLRSVLQPGRPGAAGQALELRRCHELIDSVERYLAEAGGESGWERALGA